MAKNDARIEITALDRTHQAFQSVERNFAGLQQASQRVANVLAGLGGVLSAGAFIGIVRQAVSAAAALDDLAEKTGGSVEGLSKLSDIARIGGHDSALLETGLIRLTKALSGADEESKGAGAAIAALGLDFDKLRALAPDEAFQEIARAFARFEDGAGKTSTALALFGKSGAQLLPLLKDIAEQSGRVASLTAEQAAAAEKLEKNWNALAVSASNWARALVSDLVPALNKFFELANKKDVGFGGAIDATIGYALRKKLGVGDKNIQTEIREQSDKLAQMIEDREKSLLPSVLGPTETDIENLRAYVAGLKELSSIEALAGAGSPYSREGRLPQLPYIPSTAPAARAAAKIPGLGMEVPGFQDESVVRENQRLAKLAETYSALADPLQRYREQLFEVQALRDKGLITAEVATEAEWRINEAMDKQAGIFEDLPAKIEDANSMVKELGLTFTSAFEDAVVGGKKLSEVLRALGQDILKIAARKAVTEPVGKLFGGMFEKLFNAVGFHTGGIVGLEGGPARALPALAFAAAPRFHSGLIPDEFPAVLKRGEGVFTPAQMRALGAAQVPPVSVTLNVSTGVAATVRAEMMNLLPAIHKSTVAAVADARLRGANV